MRKFLLIPILLSLSACAALGTFSQIATPASNQLLQAGIDLAVAQAVGSDKAKAAAIKAIAQQVATDAANPTATVATLESALNAKIASLSKNPADTAAFMILTGTLQAFLNGKIQAGSTGTITAATSVAIVGLAQAVVTATSFYGV